jgi:thymidylate kinase
MGTAYLPTPLHYIAYQFFVGIVPTSQHMFFLDASPAVAERRLRENRERLEMFENISDLERTRLKALSLTSTGKWIIVDANAPMKNVQETMRRTLGLNELV